MFNSYTKVPSPDNSDDEVDPLDSFMAQIEVSRSCELLMDDKQWIEWGGATETQHWEETTESH